MAKVTAGSKLNQGEMRVFDIDGTKVGVAAAGGRLYAFDNACTHWGAPSGRAGTWTGAFPLCADRGR
jgi:nitrite reductase/ring-hydroxylating ferredoxin subunit